MKCNINLVTGDVISAADDLRAEGQLFHAILTDPPYHLTSITKRFGGKDSAPAKAMKSGDKAFQRLSRGFMGQTWDGGDIAFNPDTWATLGELLYPGGFGMAFASSRGWHRMAVAIEDAGFVLHNTIFGWAFGSGFPKATRVKGQPDFDGHRYGMQALKPALEPIIVFQKPFEGRPIDSIVATGAGALNIDAGRVESDPWTRSTLTRDDIRGGNYIKMGAKKVSVASAQEMSPLGRWPANLTLLHSDRCTNEGCTGDCPVRLLGEQTGERAAGSPTTGNEPSVGKNDEHIYGHFKDHHPIVPRDDTGTAARFFFNAEWADEVAEQINDAEPVHYAAKASQRERNAGLHARAARKVNDGRQKAIDNAYQRGETQRLNIHPTVKPLSLARWLASLLLPPDSYAPRRLLVPFAGSGSEMIGAMQAGWDEIVGVERELEYANIAGDRIEYYRGRTNTPSKRPKLPIGNPKYTQIGYNQMTLEDAIERTSE